MSFFPEKVLFPPADNELEISVFGPGYGESIVLHIPGIGWGIIDSCVARIGKAQVVPPLNYLLEMFPSMSPSLAFVILTHPHEDHYRGLEQVLRKYPGGIQRICRYDGDGVRELKVYLAQQRAGHNYILRGLPDVFKAMSEAEKSGAQLRRLTEMSTVFESENVDIKPFGLTNIRMVALSPSASSIQKYIEILYKTYPVIGGPTVPVNDEAHNLLSVALLLKLGDIQIILGSDVESGTDDNIGWRGIILNRDCPALWASIVKVSHHGSQNGFSPPAWEKHCEKIKPVAIISPFWQGNTVLPKKEDLDNLKKVSSKVGVTASVRFEKNLHKYYTREVVRSLLNSTRSARVVEPPRGIGFIRVRSLLNGQITESRAESPAMWC